jgi:hypothetical protein
MQALWNRAMFLTRTRGAYGCAFPMPGTSYPPPTQGTMLFDILFCAIASEEEYTAHLEAVRENMIGWKERVRSGKSGRTLTRHEPIPRLEGIDLSKLEFKL